MRYTILNWPDLHERPEDEFPSYRPLALTTARLLAQRWPLYVIGTLVVLVIEAAFVLLVHVKGAAYYPQLIAQPLLIAVTTVFIGADATRTFTTAQRWERILERAWAIIVVDMGISFVAGSGLFTAQAGAVSADATNLLYGVLTVLLSGMLVYAEPFIMLENDAHTLTMVPFAILRSMMLAWVNIPRIFALLAVTIGITLIATLAEQTAPVAARAWIEMIVATIFTAPVAALYTVAYLDTLSQERRAIG